MKGFKAFEKGLICRGKQYAENTVFEEETAEICKSGMHFCRNPLDVLDYYPLIDDNGNMSDFAEVEALDETHTDDEKKFCTKKLKIGAKLSLKEFIKASFTVAYENIKKEVEEATKCIEPGGNRAKLAGGNRAKLAGGAYATLAGGAYAKLAGGDDATLAGGDNATLAGGNRAKLAGGAYAKLAGGAYAKLAGGDDAKLAGGDNATLAGGAYAKLAGGAYATLAGGAYATLAGGDDATLAGGNRAKLAGGAGALVVGDHGSVAKGGMGALLVIAERNENGEIVSFGVAIVDGEKIKADTFYKLENGAFTEGKQQ